MSGRAAKGRGGFQKVLEFYALLATGFSLLKLYVDGQEYTMDDLKSAHKVLKPRSNHADCLLNPGNERHMLHGGII